MFFKKLRIKRKINDMYIECLEKDLIEMINAKKAAEDKINKAIEYIEQLPFNDLTPLEVKVIYKILGGKE